VVESELGREIAAFLLEFLPFEEAAGDMLESVRLVLQPGLIDEEETRKLWQRAQSKRNMLVGFLHALPDALPVNAVEHSLLTTHRQCFEEYGSDIAAILKRAMSAPGQAFLLTCEQALTRVSDQDVVISLFEAIADYFREARFTDLNYRDIAELETAVNKLEGYSITELDPYLRSVLFLSAISVELLNPIFAHTDAIGSGMRKKISPVSGRIFHHLAVVTAPA
jgi:hypothetical protein